jgi:hypothetical protein
MAAPGTEFDLSRQAERIEAPVRSTEWIGDGVAAVFAVLGLVVLGFLLEHPHPARLCLGRDCWKATPPEYFGVYALLLVVTFGIALAAFGLSRRPRIQTPQHLRISDEGLHFTIKSGRDILVPWPVGVETLTLVDQRSLNGAGPRSVVVDGVLPIPPGSRRAALTGAAVDAILDAARAQHLTVVSRLREADRSAGGLQPVREYRISPAAPTPPRRPAGGPATSAPDRGAPAVKNPASPDLGYTPS